MLSDMMPDEDWVEADDDIISDAVRRLSKWQEQWICIERSYRKYENMALKHSLVKLGEKPLRLPLKTEGKDMN